MPALAKGCAGCAFDHDCPHPEKCNLNNRRCVRFPEDAAGATLEMAALDFVFDGKKSRNLQWSIGFQTHPDPAFDPYALAAGACRAERSTFEVNAPFPLGPFRDAGDAIELRLPAKKVAFARSRDDNPNLGFFYRPSTRMVTDWTPGQVAWSGPGGADVGAFSASGAIPAEFTTTPDLLAATLTAPAAKGITVTFGAPAAAGVGSWLEVSWNEGMGNTVTSLHRIACRAADGANSIAIPGALLERTPRGAELNLIATRAIAATFTARGVTRGRAVWAMQKAGGVILR